LSLFYLALDFIDCQIDGRIEVATLFFAVKLLFGVTLQEVRRLRVAKRRYNDHGAHRVFSSSNGYLRR